MSHLFNKLANRGAALTADRDLWTRRAEAIYSGCNPAQQPLIDSARDGYLYLALRCPRRAGKSFALTALALWWGEMHPGSRILIISLTLKSTKENFWSSAPGGIFKQNAQYGLGLVFNNTELTWVHENGSRGALKGAETLADIERIRGAAAEADIAIIDECKSFAPSLLNDLIRDVLEPGLMTRNGILVLAGTPGSIPIGTFYQATSPLARTGENEDIPTCIPVDAVLTSDIYKQFSLADRKAMWRLHSWTIQDNIAAPQQWARALNNKRKSGWTDDNPVWRREYLGEWITDALDLVYSWAGARASGKSVTWTPQRTKDNSTGLPADLGPWRLILGIDLGYVDDTALVLAAYSERTAELRHVWDFKSPGMTVDVFMEEVFSTIERFGRPDAIVADTAGGGSKMLIETLNQRYGLGIEQAKKTEKQDHIELLNSDFHAERIKIIPNSDLAHELEGLQWDLSRESKMVLSRTGRLREDPRCPNHLCDALLYLWRYSYHFWSTTPLSSPDPGTPEFWRQWEQHEVDKAVAKKRADRANPYQLQRTIPARRPWN